jgi:hypothetical protein
VGGAQHLLTELDAETDRIWAERHQIVEDARGLATQLIGLAEAAVERFPAADERARAYGHHEDHTDEHDVGGTGEHPADHLAHTEEHALGDHDFEDHDPAERDLHEHEAEPGEDDTGELPEPSGPHTEPFDIESEAPLRGEEPTTQHTLPLRQVEPPDDDDLLSHDAE